MPFETTPRIFALRSFIPFGSVTPGLAKGVFMPCTTFGAPQTTSIKLAAAVDTLHTLSLSASGMFTYLDDLGDDDLGDTRALRVRYRRPRGRA